MKEWECYLVYRAHGCCDSAREMGVLVRLRPSRSAYIVALQCHAFGGNIID